MQRAELSEAIFANMQKIHRAGSTKFHLLLGQQDISLSQMELLVTVKQRQPISVKDIAAHMQLTPGAVTQLMEGLVAKGYLERHAGVKDRRVTNVVLAEGGKRQLEALWERRKAMMQRIVDTLDTEELAIMLRVQEKMLAHIEQCAGSMKTEA